MTTSSDLLKYFVDFSELLSSFVIQDLTYAQPPMPAPAVTVPFTKVE